jgi:hypothetical protein
MRRLAAISANTWSATSRYASARAGSSSERRIQYSKLLKVSSELSSWCATAMVLDKTASLAAEVAMPFDASDPYMLPQCQSQALPLSTHIGTTCAKQMRTFP